MRSPLGHGDSMTFICDECIKSSSEKLKLIEHKQNNNISEFIPSKIYEKLNECVIGQEEAKKILSVAIYNHKKRLNDSTGLIKKSNILMAGPSGCGKTLLAKTLADIMDVPFAIADATSLTAAGYVGDDVESIILKLIMEADGDIGKAQKGIIYIDEIDKLANASETDANRSNASKDGVQYSLLKLIEGSEILISLPSTTHGNFMQQKKIMFDTSKILFICGGAFEGMFDREISKGIGFNTELSSIEAEKNMNTEILKEFGLRAEFIGRLPIQVKLNELSKDDLVRILTEPKNALVKEYKELFLKDNVELNFTQDALDKIADIAIESKVGARGLRSILEKVMLDLMFDVPNHKDYKSITITKNTIENRIPEIIYQNIEIKENVALNYT